MPGPAVRELRMHLPRQTRAIARASWDRLLGKIMLENKLCHRVSLWKMHSLPSLGSQGGGGVFHKGWLTQGFGNISQAQLL